MIHLSHSLCIKAHMAGQAAACQAEYGVAWLEVFNPRANCNHHPGAVSPWRSRVSRVHAQHVEHVPAACTAIQHPSAAAA